MGTEKVEIVKNMYGAFERGDMDAVCAMMADDIEWNEAENYPYAGGNPYIGPTAVFEGVLAPVARDWTDFSIAIEGVLDTSEDKVVVYGRYNGIFTSTGKSISAQVVHIWAVADRGITGFQQYADTFQVRHATEA